MRRAWLMHSRAAALVDFSQNKMSSPQVDVDERWSAEQLLSHDFLKMAAENRKIVPLINAAKAQLDKQNH